MQMILGVTPIVHDVALLTTAEVARRIGKCRATVCLAVKEGRLAAAMKLPGPNGAYLFTEAAVVAWRSPGRAAHPAPPVPVGVAL